ncbi:MAG: dienelactone hydrolase family protein [Alphaproteobacteria bacterium]|nr:dienelactone hydrolase family protein [Alphaproteobacteria bacterium]MCB9927955.1 dienelactone hydrolase family protein [Alphaproteobacteria bacterium]
MLNWVQIPAHDGGSFDAHLVRPAGGTAAGVVVCIQEIFGVNHAMRDIAQDWASKGYIAIAPDLFWRQEPHVDITDATDEEWKKAFELYQGFDVENGIADLKATVAYARKLDGSNGKVGTVGFCLGGKLAYLMACRSDADCNIGYYGVGIEEALNEAANIKAPLVLHIAEEDGFVPKEAQAKVKAGLAGNAHATVYSYPGMDHAFARIGGKPYNKDNADLANGRTAEVFAKTLK